jgi:2-(1,2-epoxy-1,2-dihydrophenyl)acetyl-CoA isomerase
VVTLNRPEAGNTVDMALARALEQAVAMRGRSGGALRGADRRGKLFCGGGDIASSPRRRSAALSVRSGGRCTEAVLVLARMDKPLVTLVNGPAAGAGLSLALLGDVVLAGGRAFHRGLFRHRPDARWRDELAAAAACAWRRR